MMRSLCGERKFVRDRHPLNPMRDKPKGEACATESTR